MHRRRSRCRAAPAASARPAGAPRPARPSTPTAAASDGVARPPYIEPSTHAIRNNAGASSFSAAKRSRHRDAARSLRSASGTSVRLQRGVDHHPGHEAAGQQQARDEAGGEQLDDRDVAEHAVDDHDVRRRDQEAERAGAGERADRDVLGVAALAAARRATMRPTTCVVAADEPEIAAKIEQPMTLTCSRRPGSSAGPRRQPAETAIATAACGTGSRPSG